MLSLLPLLPLAASLFPFIRAQTVVGGSGSTTNATCGWASTCPKSSPCCGEYGICGSGQTCLSGCDPQGSYSSQYCAPVPVCQSANYTFDDTSRIQTNFTAWNGNATEYDFTLDHIDNNKTALVQGGNLQLVLTEAGGGTRLSTTRTVLYGNITASIKSIGTVGIVTAFITMSGTKDEIDWELVGNGTDAGQSNYFWEGDTANFTHGGTEKAANRDQNFIEYGIVWEPEQLLWTVNGAVVRTLTKASTLDTKVAGLYHYPQTPSRVQLSVWPAGISSEPAGTIEWAGGLIDWTSSAYTSQGYFASYVQWLSISCYDDSSVNFVSYNDTVAGGTSNSTWKRDLWERASSNDVQSWIYGVNNTAGQIAVSGSDSPTIIDSTTSTGIKMLTKAAVVPPTAAGKWWQGLPIAAKVGIAIGGVAVLLVCIICVCTCWARRNDKKKYAALETPSGGRNNSSRDNIPLVEKKFNKEQYSPSYSASQSSVGAYGSNNSKPYHQPAQDNRGQYGKNQYDGSQAPRPQWPQQQPSPNQQYYSSGGAYSNPFNGAGAGQGHAYTAPVQQGGGYQGQQQRW